MSTPGDDAPGRHSPGLAHPQFDNPGAHNPGDVEQTTQSAAGVAIDATGTTTLGTVDGDRDIAELVTVNATAADFNFRVSVGGDNLFDSAQSPSGTTAEEFVPPESNAVITGAENAAVVFEVTSASGTGGATADVDVDVLSDEMNY